MRRSRKTAMPSEWFKGKLSETDAWLILCNGEPVGVMSGKLPNHIVETYCKSRTIAESSDRIGVRNHWAEPIKHIRREDIAPTIRAAEAAVDRGKVRPSLKKLWSVSEPTPDVTRELRFVEHAQRHGYKSTEILCPEGADFDTFTRALVDVFAEPDAQDDAQDDAPGSLPFRPGAAPSDYIDQQMAHGFSLIELLVCIAIIALLMGLTMIGFRSRAVARETVCRSNQRQIMLAMMDYVSIGRKSFPTQATSANITFRQGDVDTLELGAGVWWCPEDRVRNTVDANVVSSYYGRKYLFNYFSDVKYDPRSEIMRWDQGEDHRPEAVFELPGRHGGYSNVWYIDGGFTKVRR